MSYGQPVGRPLRPVVVDARAGLAAARGRIVRLQPLRLRARLVRHDPHLGARVREHLLPGRHAREREQLVVGRERRVVLFVLGRRRARDGGRGPAQLVAVRHLVEIGRALVEASILRSAPVLLPRVRARDRDVDDRVAVVAPGRERRRRMRIARSLPGNRTPSPGVGIGLAVGRRRRRRVGGRPTRGDPAASSVSLGPRAS